MDERPIKLPSYEPTPLDSLVVDERTLFEPKRLAEMLEKFARFTAAGDFVAQPAFDELDNQRKTVVFLLAKKAMKLKGFAADDCAGPAEVARACSMPGGSAKTALRRLNGFMVESCGKGYCVPAKYFERVKKVLQDAGKPRR